MGSFRAAIAILTRLPMPGTAHPRMGAGWFGVVGGLVGAGAFVPMVALAGSLPVVGAILAVAAMAILSGALHLDGLADTADALIAMGPGAAERARTDPSIGVAGAVALVLVLAADVAALTSLASTGGSVVAGLACVGAGAGSRAAPVVIGRISRSPARATGFGAAFAAQVSTADAIVAVATALGVVAVAALAATNLALLAGGVAGTGVGAIVGLAVVRLRGQLDGDGFGASVELTFAAIVIVIAWAAAVGRAPAT